MQNLGIVAALSTSGQLPVGLSPRTMQVLGTIAAIVSKWLAPHRLESVDHARPRYSCCLKYEWQAPRRLESEDHARPRYNCCHRFHVASSDHGDTVFTSLGNSTPRRAEVLPLSPLAGCWSKSHCTITAQLPPIGICPRIQGLRFWCEDVHGSFPVSCFSSGRIVTSHVGLILLLVRVPHLSGLRGVAWPSALHV